jgi:carbamate kinase
MPKRIIEANLIRYMLEKEVIVICAGGGGIPVRIDEKGEMEGVEAVVDKSYTCVLLAQEINSQKIIFVSPRKRIVSAYGLNLTNGLQKLDLAAIENLIQKGEMEDTMRHKLIASKTFLQKPGRMVVIMPPDQLDADPDMCCGVQLDSTIFG